MARLGQHHLLNDAGRNHAGRNHAAVRNITAALGAEAAVLFGLFGSDGHVLRVLLPLGAGLGKDQRRDGTARR